MGVTNGASVTGENIDFIDVTGDSIKSLNTVCKVYLFGKYPDAQTMTVHFTHKKPNAWHRFWQKLLLGWVWEDEKD
jgi:hypothetical protein